MSEAELERLLKKPFATKAEVAAALNTTERSVSRATLRKDIPSVRVGPRIERIPTTWLAQQIAAAAPEAA